MRRYLPKASDIDKHFSPRYRPSQQRVLSSQTGICSGPRRGKAWTVTTPSSRSPTSDKVSSGKEIHADIVVTAPAGTCRSSVDVAFAVDGGPVVRRAVDLVGIIVDGLPNMAFIFGYFRPAGPARGPGRRPGAVACSPSDAGRRATMVVPTFRRRTRYAASAVVGSGEFQRRQ